MISIQIFFKHFNLNVRQLVLNTDKAYRIAKDYCSQLNFA